MSSTPHGSAIYQQPARLLQHLIRFNTTNPPGNEAACVSYIRDLLEGIRYAIGEFGGFPLSIGGRTFYPIQVALSGVSDARFFSRLGIQTYGFLPMQLPEGFNFLQTIHAPDERIPVEALEFGTNAIYTLFQRFGGKTPLITSNLFQAAIESEGATL